MMIVFCNDSTCVHNRNGNCSLIAIELEVREGEFKEGKREVFNACQNYRSNDDGEN